MIQKEPRDWVSSRPASRLQASDFRLRAAEKALVALSLSQRDGMLFLEPKA
jgi:hypothetical protein